VTSIKHIFKLKDPPYIIMRHIVIIFFKQSHSLIGLFIC